MALSSFGSDVGVVLEQCSLGTVCMVQEDCSDVEILMLLQHGSSVE